VLQILAAFVPGGNYQPQIAKLAGLNAARESSWKGFAKAAMSGQIFICYRREESRWSARSLLCVTP